MSAQTEADEAYIEFPGEIPNAPRPSDTIYQSPYTKPSQPFKAGPRYEQLLLTMSPSKENNSGLERSPNAPPPTLPPSVEEAYKKKCIELRGRMIEVEEQNDIMRLRKIRLIRSIRKMRLERAILLDALAKRMRKTGSDDPLGAYDDDSEDSSIAPPTPQERPLRTKKSHRRTLGLSPPPSSTPLPLSTPGQPIILSNPLSSAHATVASPAAGNGASNAAFLSSDSISSQNLRPAPPKDLFAAHMISTVIPENPEQHPEYPAEGKSAQRDYVEKLWSELQDKEKNHWVIQYEAHMSEWTRHEDARKREKMVQARRNKKERESDSQQSQSQNKGSGSGDDIEMGGTGSQ